jgi:hypothetical protein
VSSSSASTGMPSPTPTSAATSLLRRHSNSTVPSGVGACVRQHSCPGGGFTRYLRALSLRFGGLRRTAGRVRRSRPKLAPLRVWFPSGGSGLTEVGARSQWRRTVRMVSCHGPDSRVLDDPAALAPAPPSSRGARSLGRYGPDRVDPDGFGNVVGWCHSALGRS